MEMEEILDIAKDFIQRKGGYYTYKLTKINLNDETGKWTVEFDVGYLTAIILSLQIDDKTGRITSYERKST